MQRRKILTAVIAGSLLLANHAAAHTTVKPATVGIAKFQTFIVSAPSEKPIATVGIRLVLPKGLNHVSPNVKPGWKVEVKKAIENGEEKAIEINWTGGSIPAEMRDEFNFSAQAPSQPGTLAWKAYQTYADGSVVAWDQDPNMKTDHDSDFSNMGPYSKTDVIDDLSTTIATVSTQKTGASTDKIAIVLSVLALLVSLTAIKKSPKV